jgi:hypothetical protein
MMVEPICLETVWKQDRIFGIKILSFLQTSYDREFK